MNLAATSPAEGARSMHVSVRTTSNRTGATVMEALPWRSRAVSTHLRTYVSEQLTLQANSGNSWNSPPYPFARCLEVGCGTGENLSFLFFRSFFSVGVDIVPAALAEARARHSHSDTHRRSAFVCADLLAPEAELHARIARGEPEVVVDHAFAQGGAGSSGPALGPQLHRGRGFASRPGQGREPRRPLRLSCRSPGSGPRLQGGHDQLDLKKAGSNASTLKWIFSLKDPH